jgi:hypothetical protein
MIDRKARAVINDEFSKSKLNRPEGKKSIETD